MKYKVINFKTITIPLLIVTLVGCGSVAIPIGGDDDMEINSPAVGNDSAEMVVRNNEIRAEVYSGYPITWNESLALSAQSHADKLASTDSFEHSDTPNGENLFASSVPVGYMAAIDSWYKEKRDYNLDTKSCNLGEVCGHYTQLIWQETTEVGCGKASSPSLSTIIVCQYNPPGNYMGETPF